MKNSFVTKLLLTLLTVSGGGLFAVADSGMMSNNNNNNDDPARMRRMECPILAKVEKIPAVESAAKEWKHDKQAAYTADLAQLISDMEGKTIKQPGELLNKAIKIESKMIKVVTPKVKEIAQEIKDPQVRQELMSAVKKMHELANQLDRIPAIDQMVPIKYDKVREILGLLGELMAVKSEAIGNIAQQLDSKAAEKVSQYKLKKSEMLRDAVA